MCPQSSSFPCLQLRLCLLCVGTSLVLGPILGKSWRLYKVFTQRVPDKRVVSTECPEQHTAVWDGCCYHHITLL